MEADQIRLLKPRLTRFLKQFDDCFARKDTRAHLPVYVRGQLSNLPDKSVEPIAVEADMPPRTLQEFLSQLKWDHDRMRDRVQEIVYEQNPFIYLVNKDALSGISSTVRNAQPSILRPQTFWNIDQLWLQRRPEEARSQ